MSSVFAVSFSQTLCLYVNRLRNASGHMQMKAVLMRRRRSAVVSASRKQNCHYWRFVAV